MAKFDFSRLFSGKGYSINSYAAFQFLACSRRRLLLNVHIEGSLADNRAKLDRGIRVDMVFWILYSYESCIC